MTSPQYIWRIEDAGGLGPYNGSVNTAGYRNKKRNPLPGVDKVRGKKGTIADYVPVDFLGQPPRELLFGFDGPQQLQAWFCPADTIKAEKWEDKGYHISVYKTDDRPVLVSDHQLTFFAVAPKLPSIELPLSDLWTETPKAMEAEAQAATFH